MDQDIKEEFNKLNERLNTEVGGLRTDVGGFRQEFKEFKDFVVEHVALKSDLEKYATKDDLQAVKNEVVTKIDSFAKDVKRIDEESVVANRRLSSLELKTGII